ncbi:Uncharacterised protein [Mycobacteroides abscessus subsp. abscessus]|nr:Uncharacterised protein [Mycobacteroides abscessus subsp. abscessus]
MPIAVIRNASGLAPRRRNGRYATRSRPTAAPPETTMPTTIAKPR